MNETSNSSNLAHDIKPGDIFYSSWGWEQTNIDFYQVISTTAKTVKIRKINQTRDYNASAMSGKTTAIPNDFASNEVLLKKPYFWDNSWRLNLQHGAGCKWDGDELSYSTYA
jgi:hypothetical protein